LRQGRPHAFGEFRRQTLPAARDHTRDETVPQKKRNEGLLLEVAADDFLVPAFGVTEILKILAVMIGPGAMRALSSEQLLAKTRTPNAWPDNGSPAASVCPTSARMQPATRSASSLAGIATMARCNDFKKCRIASRHWICLRHKTCASDRDRGENRVGAKGFQAPSPLPYPLCRGRTVAQEYLLRPTD
jgi:hypothetical protein